MLGTSETILLGCTCYIIGTRANKTFLHKLSLPSGVLGAVFVLTIVKLFSYATTKEIEFNQNITKELIMIFFATIGMSSKIKNLTENKIFYRIIILVAIFIFLQNLIGVLCAFCAGVHMLNGILVGSISLAGGHGTSMSWGTYFEEIKTLKNAKEIGLFFSTIGLISGSFIGNFLSDKIITKRKLFPEVTNLPVPIPEKNRDWDLYLVSKILCMIYLCLYGGSFLNLHVKNYINMPQYIHVLILGMIASYFYPLLSQEKVRNVLALVKEFTLTVSVALNILTINISTIRTEISPLFIIFAFQCLFTALFANYVFFPWTGKNYTSAVLTSGFVGSGMGSAAIGLENIETTSKKHGESPPVKIFFPYLASVIFDTINALIVQIFVFFLI